MVPDRGPPLPAGVTPTGRELRTRATATATALLRYGPPGATARERLRTRVPKTSRVVARKSSAARRRIRPGEPSAPAIWTDRRRTLGAPPLTPPPEAAPD